MKKKPDKLAEDVSKALAAGMSYGKWKAMQPPVEEKGIREGWLVCKYCGEPFKPKTKKKQSYCGYYCQQQAYAEKLRQQKKERVKNDG